MHWTSQGEKEIMKEWSGKFYTENLTKQYFSEWDANMGSYWCNHDANNEIIDYGFETVPELKELLEHGLADNFYKEIYLPLAVAAFKEKQSIQFDTEILEDSHEVFAEKDGFSIPDFVYVF